MGRYSKEFFQACQELGCLCSVLDLEASRRLHAEIQVCFTDGTHVKPLWERLVEKDSLYDPEGWRYIESFVKDQSPLIFFDDDDSVVLLKNGSDLTNILLECTGFVFYVTNQAYNYLVCFNDHDMLIGVGTAKEWIATLKLASP